MTDGQQKVLSVAVQWLAGQPFSNVLLVAILGSLLWFGHYSLTVAVPSHLKQIQDGYDRIDRNHRDEREMLRQTYEKWIDRRSQTGSGAGSFTILPEQS